MTEAALCDGYDVVTAANREEALNHARAQAPEVVVADLTLEEDNGWSLIRALRADLDLCRVPVVVLSARPDAEPPADVGPCAAYLRKPCPMAVLRGVLRRVVVEPRGSAKKPTV